MTNSRPDRSGAATIPMGDVSPSATSLTPMSLGSPRGDWACAEPSEDPAKNATTSSSLACRDAIGDPPRTRFFMLDMSLLDGQGVGDRDARRSRSDRSFEHADEHHASTVKNRSLPEGRLRLLHRAATGPLVHRLRAQVIEGARLASDR